MKLYLFMKRKMFIGLMILVIISTNQLLAQQTVGNLVNNAGTYDGFTLFTARHYYTSYLINNEGRIINEWTQSESMRVENCKLLENGQLIRSVNLLLPFYRGKPGAHGKLELVNWDGTVAWTMTYADSSHILHHDVVPIIQNDGSYHFLASSWDVIPADTAIVHGRNPSAVGGSDNYILLERIIEIEPIGISDYNIVWQWSVMDHLVQQDYPNASNYISNGVVNNPQLFHFNYFKNNLPSTKTISDWMHVSGLDFNSELDHIVFSNHGANELIIIDHSTTTAEAAGHTGGNSGKGGDILYRWGNPKAYGVNSQVHFQALHSPHWIPDSLVHGGKIMIINNGFNSGSSSIEIITPPVDASGQYVVPPIGSAFGPQNLDWSYSNGSNFHTGNMGNGQRQPNGNTLINEAVKGRFFEVDTDENIVWEYRCPTIASGPMEYNVDLSTIPVTNSNGDLENEVFKIIKYPKEYSGFNGKDVTPKGTIEIHVTGLNEKDNYLKSFQLHQNFPNPFNPSTTINYTVSKDSKVKIEVFDILGSKIKTLIDEFQNSGKYTIRFDATGLPSGIYFYTMKAINFKKTKQMLYLK